MTGERINRFLDALPRARRARGMGDAPAFRACGVAGCRPALVAAPGGGFPAGRSLRVVSVLCVAAALCGLAPVYLKRLLTGREMPVRLKDYDGRGRDDYLEEVEAGYDALGKATAPPATP